MRIIFLMFLGVILGPTYTAAAIADNIVLNGTISNIESPIIWIKTKSGEAVVPEVWLPKNTNIRPGSKVSLKVSMRDLILFNRAFKQK